MTTTGQRRSAALRPHTIGLWVLFLCDAGLLVASGLIHLHQEQHVERLHVPVGDVPQVVACLLLAVVLLVTRRLLAVAAAWLLMAGTIVGFILARTVGIFGFKLTFSTGLANTVLIVEAAALIMLTITGMVKVRSSRSRA